LSGFSIDVGINIWYNIKTYSSRKIGDFTLKITFDNITKIFTSQSDKNKKVAAVEHLNLEIPSGKMVAIIGPSGCGKSTILNLISGLEKATEGTLYFDEQDVTKLKPEERSVGMVSQNCALNPRQTVLENIMAPLSKLKGTEKMTKEDMEVRAYAVAHLARIESCMDRKASELSASQLQRAAIACAMVKTPQILLLDEPFVNLDANFRSQIREEIRQIQQKTGMTVVLVTQDQQEALATSDEVVLMNGGVIRQIGTPQEVYEQPVNLQAAKLLGTPTINTFYGEVKDGGLYIGIDKIMEVSGIADQQVTIGIRPEGFVLDSNGTFHVTLNVAKSVGRETTILCDHPACYGTHVYAIVSSADEPDTQKQLLTFSIRPKKVNIFQLLTDELIPVQR